MPTAENPAQSTPQPRPRCGGQRTPAGEQESPVSPKVASSTANRCPAPCADAPTICAPLTRASCRDDSVRCHGRNISSGRASTAEWLARCIRRLQLPDWACAHRHASAPVKGNEAHDRTKHRNAPHPQIDSLTRDGSAA